MLSNNKCVWNCRELKNGIMEKISYERRVYESVDEESTRKICLKNLRRLVFKFQLLQVISPINYNEM